MPDYSGGGSKNDWAAQAANPSAPAGLQQTSQAGAGVDNAESRYAGSKLGQWATDPNIGTVGAAQSWFSGANVDSTLNGWSTPFYDSFFAQQEEAMKEGTLGSFFDRQGATGVVTWDHASQEDPKKEYRFGDIYENGELKGNVYKLYDQDTANMMMGTFMLDADEQERAYRGAATEDESPMQGEAGQLRIPKLDEAIKEKREWNDKNLAKAYSAMEFQSDVDARAEQFAEGVGVDEAIAVGGGFGGGVLAAGAAAGGAAALGTSWSGPGAAVAGLIGFGVGATAAWLNRDSLTEQAARAYEITAMAKREYGTDAGLATGLHQASRFGSRLIMPTSNLVQGLADVTAGKAGDGEAEFYRMDDKGERKIGSAWIAADLAGTVADSALQFASPLGLAVYSTQMSGTIVGQVAELGATGGATFDDRAGRFDNIFYDTDSKTGETSFSPGDAAAGIGAIGIDAVQLGFARGLAGKVDAARLSVGDEALYGSSTMMGRVLDRVSSRPKWLGGQSDDAAARAALANGGREERLGGFAYVVNAEGQAVSRRATLSLLAPSEQLMTTSASMWARRAAARKAGAMSTDDVYKAAYGLSTGQSKWRTALVNGMGEGYEEFVQAALEPISHDANMDGSDMAMAALYGFGGGLGMGVAANFASPSTRSVLESQARVAYRTLTDGADMTDAELRSMSEDELRKMVGTMTQAQREVSSSAAQRTVDSLTAENVAGIAGVAKLQDAIRTKYDSDLAKGAARTDGAFVVTPLEAAGRVDNDGNLISRAISEGGLPLDSIPAHGIATSAGQLLANVQHRNQGLVLQLEGLQAEVERLSLDPEQADALVKAQKDLAEQELVVQWSEKIEAAITPMLEQISTNTDVFTRAADVTLFNEQMRQWFDGQLDTWNDGTALTPADKRSLMRAITQVWARDPHDSSGSYQLLVPQLSLQLSANQAHNVIQVSSGILKAIRGDHDGDKLRQLNQLFLDEDTFTAGRAGSWYIGTGTTVHVDAPKQEKYLVEAMSTSLKQDRNKTLQSEASAALIKIGDAVKRRYSGLGVDAALDKVTGRFYDAVRANAKDARAVLLDGLATEVGGPLNDFARGNMSNEWLWIDQLVRSSLQQFQEIYVSHRRAVPKAELADLGLDAVAPAPLARSNNVRESLGRRVATMGATMQLMLVGSSPFRMFQKLHYTTVNAAVLENNGVTPMALDEMALWYESLGQSMAISELDRVLGVDDIALQVQRALDEIANDATEVTTLAQQAGATLPDGTRVRPLAKHEALTVVANMAVADFVVNDQGEYVLTGKQISLAQMLLKLAVQADQADKARVMTDALAAKHSRLLDMTKPGGGRNNPVNAEKAFVEIFGATQLGVLLGEQAAAFGPQVTVEQYLRQYAGMREEERKSERRKLKGDPNYVGRKQTKSLPYDMSEIIEQDSGKARVTPFRSVADVIMAVGDYRQTEWQLRDAKVSEQWVTSHQQMRQGFRELVGLDGRNLELEIGTIQRALEQHPEFARKVFDLIPNAAASVVFDVRGDDVYVNNWFYEMLAEPDAKRAEMILWRANLLETWRAAAIDPNRDETGVKYDQLTRRMHRLIYRAAKAGDMGVRTKDFMDNLWSNDTVEGFISWVNDSSGLLINEAPIVAWFDDVAEFDADRAGGGWTTSLAGSELREAITALNSSSSNLIQGLQEERALLEADVQYLQAIDRVVAANNGTSGRAATKEDQEIYRRMESWIDRAGDLASTLGPQAMFFQALGNAWGFYGQAHNKGKNPAHVEALGMFDARRDEIGFLHNYSRVMGALTAHDTDAVSASMNLVARDGGRAMDDYGNVVEWTKPTVEQMANLLRDPKTRAYARAIMYPTVLERTESGQLSEQMLMGKSLKELITGQAYQDLFPDMDFLQRPAAFKYAALVETYSRKFGGHLPLSRAVNDIVIARLQAATNPLSFEDVESMVGDAFYEVAQIMQKVGAIAAQDEVQGTERLAELKKQLKDDRKAKSRAKRLGVLGASRLTRGAVDVVDETLQLFRGTMEQEFLDELGRLNAEVAKATGADKTELANLAALRQQEMDNYLENFDQLVADDEVAPVVASFALTSPQGDLAAWEQATSLQRQTIVRFVEQHPELVTRVPEAMPVLSKLQYQLMDSAKFQEIDLTAAEWDMLSRAAIGVVLTDSAGPVGQGVSVRLFPDEKHLSDRRYYDRSYSYLLDPLLDKDSAMVQAARQIHLDAERQADFVQPADLIPLITDKLFDEYNIGPWSEEVVVASTEANSRIDSAAAAPAVAIAGQSPKNEATLSAATQRTFVVPPDELLSTVALRPADFDGDVYADVTVALPGGTTSTRKLAQLNGRFVRSAVLVDDQGNQVDLLADNPNLGYSWVGDSRAVIAGAPVAVTLDRLAEAANASVRKLGLRPENIASVQVAYFDPETQPATPEFYNNLWFEGTSFGMNADRMSSLNETLWFVLGGLSPEGQAAALDASKSGKTAMQVIATPSSAARAEDEAGWKQDFGAMLRAKTQRILDTDMGFGKLDVTMWNAIYKGVKMRHFVITDQGVLTAEDVLGMQARGEEVVGELWTPSDKVLRSMLGEQGSQGVNRIFDQTLEFDPNRVPAYRGVSPMMMERFREGLTGGKKQLEETSVVHRARQTNLVVRAVAPRKVRDAYAARRRRMVAERAEGYAERTSTYSTLGDWTGANMQAAVNHAGSRLRREDLAFAFEDLGVPFVGPRDPQVILEGTAALQELNAAQASDGRRTGWILSNSHPNGGDPTKGLISEVSFGNREAKGLRVLMDDFVSVDVSSYYGNEAKLRTQLRELSDRGAWIVLTEGNSGRDMMGEMASYARSLGYERIFGSLHAYKPMERNTVYATRQARIDTLTEVRGISPRGRQAVFNATGLPIQESGAYANTRNPDLQAGVKVISDLVPTSNMGGFGPAVRGRQLDKLVIHLQGMDDPEIVAHLEAQGSKVKADKDDEVNADSSADTATSFTRAWERLMERISDDRWDGTVLPGDVLEIGDIIPLIDSSDRIVLYRHGMQRPKAENRKQQMLERRPGSDGRMNVAVYSDKPEKAATVHTGIVREFKQRPGYGLSVEMEVPLQLFGDKMQLEYDGTKYTIVPWPNADQPGAPVLPDHTFMRTWDIGLVSDLDTRLSKEGASDMLDSHQRAFAFLGMDFLPDVTEFFFPGKGQDANSQGLTREILRIIENQPSTMSVTQAHELMNRPLLSSAFTRMWPDVAATIDAQLSSTVDPNWLSRISMDGDVSAHITTAMLIYLSTPGARVDDVLRSGSFDDESTSLDAQSVLMPQLFTQTFDRAKLGSPLRVEINRRLNNSLNRTNARPGQSYRLLQNFDFIIESGMPGKTMSGKLSFPEVNSSGDNPITNGMSFREGTTQQVSAHSVMVADQAIGAQTFAKKGVLKKAQRFQDQAFGKNQVEKLTPGTYDDGAVWRMMTNVRQADVSFDQWRLPTPAEIERRGLAYDAMVGFRQKIDKTDRWSDSERQQYKVIATKILDRLNLPSKMDVLVDGWVRQMSGRPAGMELDGKIIEPISGKAALEWVSDVLANVENALSPVMGGYVPLLHAQDLKQIFRYNEHAARAWAPAMKADADASKAETWDDYVDSIVGSALASNDSFDRFYLLPADGFLHSYQNATSQFTELPISLDVLVANQVLTLEMNELTQSIADADVTMEQIEEGKLGNVESLDPRLASMIRNPLILDTARAQLADLLGGQRIAGEFRGEAAPASEKAKQDARIRKNRRETGAPVPVAKSMADFRENSTQFMHHTSTMNSLTRGLINLRVGTALINPALYVSMLPEQFIRSSLDRVSNLITGDSTVGMIGSRVSRYTPEQIKKANDLYRAMGANPEWKSLMNLELNFQRPLEAGTGRIDRLLEKYAKIGSTMQDPTYRMRQDVMARRYMEAVLQSAGAMGTLTGLTTDEILDNMAQDPTFLKRRFPELHRHGSNAVAQIRSIKATPLTLMLRSIYEPMSTNPNPGINMFGNLVLRMPMLFAGYAGNVATTILGLQGVSDMAAMFLDGRSKGPNSLFGRIQAKMRGEEFDSERDAQFDMSSVIEGIDLSRSFIRGGLTHTGLFAFAMMAGGLGLSGEDDETKRRRRAAELQGAAFVVDPRKVENDWRNADAIYLDWLPFGLDSMFKVDGDGRAMANTHWMLKQFISPIIGIEKFMETGNFDHVKWGFMDALGAFPLINANTVSDTFETMASFERAAAEASAEGTDEAQVRAAGLLISVVGAYEKMLFENNFLSAVYVGADDWDRDPYKKVMTDSDGTIQVDALGNPRPTERLTEYIGPNGEKQTGYVQRPDSQARLATLTENRPALALFSSLFSGLGDSEFLRYNMVPKIREIEKPVITEAEKRDLVIAAFLSPNDHVRSMSREEALKVVKDQVIGAGDWDTYNNDKLMNSLAERMSRNSGVAAMSLLSPEGREELTTDGKKSLVWSVYKGSVKLDEVGGTFYMTVDERAQIIAEFTKELKAEGVAMGLTDSQADDRVARLMYGPITNPDAVGLKDIIASNQISYSDKLRYYQRNTTYVMGPDGRPWATGINRPDPRSLGGVANLLGLAPLQRYMGSGSDAMGTDNRLNSIDLVNGTPGPNSGINTGLRGLVPAPEVVPTDEELTERLEKAIKEAGNGDFSGFTPFASKNSGGYGYRRGGYTPYKRRSYGSGGYTSSGYPNFTRMYALPQVNTPYGNDIPFINTSNPILRRADVRRERIWSERGRLNQWQ